MCVQLLLCVMLCVIAVLCDVVGVCNCRCVSVLIFVGGAAAFQLQFRPSTNPVAVESHFSELKANLQIVSVGV